MEAHSNATEATGSTETTGATGFVYKIYAAVLKRLHEAANTDNSTSAGLIYWGVSLYGHLGSDFLPAVDEGSFVLDYFAPPGSSLEQTDNYALRLERIVGAEPEVTTWTRRTGAELGLFATQTNRGDILVVLKPTTARKRSIDQIMESSRLKIEESLPQLEVEFHQILQDQLNDLSGAPSPIEVRMFGEDPGVLNRISKEILTRLKPIKGLVDITSTSQAAAPEIEVRTDPLKAGRIGATPMDVSRQLQDALMVAQSHK